MQKYKQKYVKIRTVLAKTYRNSSLKYARNTQEMCKKYEFFYAKYAKICNAISLWSRYQSSLSYSAVCCCGCCTYSQLQQNSTLGTAILLVQLSLTTFGIEVQWCCCQGSGSRIVTRRQTCVDKIRLKKLLFRGRKYFGFLSPPLMAGHFSAPALGCMQKNRSLGALDAEIRRKRDLEQQLMVPENVLETSQLRAPDAQPQIPRVTRQPWRTEGTSEHAQQHLLNEWEATKFLHKVMARRSDLEQMERVCSNGELATAAPGEGAGRSSRGRAALLLPPCGGSQRFLCPR